MCLGLSSKFWKTAQLSISNYSPHTAWVREDGKQPRVIRHDVLAFVPDPRVYGKFRPAALKDFVAYKHLPRAKPRVVAKSPKLERAKQINKQEKQEQSKSQTSPKKSQTSPKKPPPENLEQILNFLSPIGLGDWKPPSSGICLPADSEFKK